MTRADLERLAKAHQPGPKENQYPAPGRRIEGFKGSTVKDRLADQLECKHLGTLSETTDALECLQTVTCTKGQSRTNQIDAY